MRTRIYDSMYWKEECFGLTGERTPARPDLSERRTSRRPSSCRVSCGVSHLPAFSVGACFAPLTGHGKLSGEANPSFPRSFAPSDRGLSRLRNSCEAESLIDKAVALTEIGGMYGNQKPVKFLCLLLKLLQLQPGKDIIYQYILNEDYKYVFPPSPGRRAPFSEDVQSAEIHPASFQVSARTWSFLFETGWDGAGDVRVPGAALHRLPETPKTAAR
ncbi:MAG: hypothetical protein BJ554DRAFT_6025 [Olpidium bornovanus]|uniref:Pre-mRNA-splicing factor 38 n=1 Tax=Olpidium bornovanus TaxID=278681 RepID=A0A8H7ZYK4_9FUNG|nr:MAG: hypothetical protein BJ554DRAFT_6025 [Olpidium bornovanus]